jgi:ATP-dependent Clp protease ATP-binding subunit ClpX
VEEALLDVMYELPSLKNVVRCLVDRDTIEGLGSPILTTESGQSFALDLEPAQQSA